jgi:hypothetical protein
MNLCKFSERGWLGYIVDVATMGAYTTYRVHSYTNCIISPTGSYKGYKQEEVQLLNKIEAGGMKVDMGQSKDTTM